MSDNKDLISLIKSQVNKATSLFSEKDLIENELREFFSIIKHTMTDDISFTFEAETDRYGDFVTTIYASNPFIIKKYTVLTYDFDNKTIFPLKISDMNDIPWLCHDLDEVKSALANIISNDDFMIRLVSISKEKDKNRPELDDDIPF